MELSVPPTKLKLLKYIEKSANHFITVISMRNQNNYKVRHCTRTENIIIQ